MRVRTLGVAAIAVLLALGGIQPASADEEIVPPWYAVKQRVKMCKTGTIVELDALLGFAFASPGGETTTVADNTGPVQINKRDLCVFWMRHSPDATGKLSASMNFKNGEPVVSYTLYQSTAGRGQGRWVSTKRALRIIARQRVKAKKECEKPDAVQVFGGFCGPLGTTSTSN